MVALRPAMPMELFRYPMIPYPLGPFMDEKGLESGTQYGDGTVMLRSELDDDKR